MCSAWAQLFLCFVYMQRLFLSHTLPVAPTHTYLTGFLQGLWVFSGVV